MPAVFFRLPALPAPLAALAESQRPLTLALGISLLFHAILLAVHFTPPDFMGNVVGDLSSRRGMIQGMDDVAGVKVIKAEVPLAEMFGYSTALRSATQGRATYTMEFKHYSEAPKTVSEAIINKK